MKKVIGQVHLWLGLTSGLVVFIISVTGCVYVFEEELKAWAYTDREEIVAAENAVKKPLSQLLAIAQQEVGKEHPIQNIEVPVAGNQTYSFRPAQIRDNKAFTHFGEIVYQRKVYINPYTGEVVKNENTKYEFFTLILRLHRNLLLNRKVGSIIIGSSVIIFVGLLITGIVLWWPKNKAAMKQRFSFKWKSSTKWKRKNYDLHSVLGFYSYFILLVIAFSGLIWSFDWFENGVIWIANGGAKTEKVKPLYSDTAQVGALPVDRILFELKRNNREAHTFNISLPEKKVGVVNASARSGIHVRYNIVRYQFDQFTGELLTTTTFGEKTAGEQLRAMNYDIHTGAIIGMPGKILAFIASLISASLPVTGFYIWWGRKKKIKADSPSRKSVAAGAPPSISFVKENL